MRVLLLAVLFLTACASDRSEPGQKAADLSQVMAVEVTNYPLEYVVNRIGGSRVKVEFRAAGEADPAYWRPTPEDVVAMQEADLIFVNGAGYEPWLNDVSLPGSRVIDTTTDVGDRLVPVQGQVTHSHGAGGEHEHAGTAFTTWLDLSILIDQSTAVADALMERWPEQGPEFKRRALELRTDLEALDAELIAVARSIESTQFVFSHPVYQYLQQRYGFAGPSVHWEPDVTPDEVALAEFDEMAGRDGFTIMIWEGTPTPATAGALRARGIEPVEFDPCAGRPDSGDLLDVLRSGVSNLQSITSH